jgi:hypothetical protein
MTYATGLMYFFVVTQPVKGTVWSLTQPICPFRNVPYVAAAPQLYWVFNIGPIQLTTA